jgi:long-chain acyl-CoA synthetase
MNVLGILREKWVGVETPFLIHAGGEIYFRDIEKQEPINLSQIHPGDVVALIGDFEPLSILTLLRLIDRGVILVPLTAATRTQHQYFFEQALVDVVIEGSEVIRRVHGQSHKMITSLRESGHSGLVLFSTGTTGRPKAILHDLTQFMRRFETPRPTLRTLSFLLFDHIGGINTLLHTLFNTGVVIAPRSRSVEDILDVLDEQNVEVLPTTPTFLRMMLMSGLVPNRVPASLKVITYGTERMDQPTLEGLCALLPNVDFRQTFGMSELGIVRVKSRNRDSLFMRIGGEGVKTRIVNGVLHIHSETRMLGYLNSLSPFDEDGWYDTKDLVEEKDGYFRIIGRISEVINVGGLKFMASEVERVALEYADVELAKAIGKPNPITGEHVELQVQAKNGVDLSKAALKAYLAENLQQHMVPRRITIETITVGHRFKRA